MIHKKILNGLTLSLMLTLVPTPAHAGWFSWIGDYFNKPTKNALVATTALAGVSLLATFACALNWWREAKLSSQEKSALIGYWKDDNAKNQSELKAAKQELAGKVQLIKIREGQLAQARNQTEQLAEELNKSWQAAQENNKKQMELEQQAQEASKYKAALESSKDRWLSVIKERQDLKAEKAALEDRLEKLKQYEKPSDE